MNKRRHLSSEAIARACAAILDFADPRQAVRMRHFDEIYADFAAQYPGLFVMCCSAGEPGGEKAAQVRRTLELMLTQRDAGGTKADVHAILSDVYGPPCAPPTEPPRAPPTP
jgi:hypothetical protein